MPCMSPSQGHASTMPVEVTKPVAAEFGPGVVWWLVNVADRMGYQILLEVPIQEAMERRDICLRPALTSDSTPEIYYAEGNY